MSCNFNINGMNETANSIQNQSQIPNPPPTPLPESPNDDSEGEGGNAERPQHVTVRSEEGIIHTLVIAGLIEGHYASPPQTKTTKYEQCLPALVAVEENDEIGGLLVVLHTVGGDVEAGLAIAEMIASMKKPTVSLVLGGGHSIGIPLAVSTKKSFIVPSATMLFHPVRVTGVVIGAPQTFEYMNRMQERIIEFITRCSKADAPTIRKLMMKTDEMTTDIGSVVEGAEAVKLGIIDSVGGLGEALDTLKTMIKESRAIKIKPVQELKRKRTKKA